MSSDEDFIATLPVVTIEPTFPQVIQEVDDGIIPSDNFWISCYKAGQPSVHAKINVVLDEVKRDVVNLTPQESNIEISKRDRNYAIACKALAIPFTNVLTPSQEYSDPERSNPQRPHRITAFDIAPDVSQFATGFLDGSVVLYPTSPSSPSVRNSQAITSKERKSSKPHLSTVTSLKFFPSSRVLLSSGADFSLSILPADLPFPPASATGTRITPARTLRSHTRAITSTAIIALGRNVLSSSLDSMIKLWDVSSGSTITSLLAHSPINGISLGERMQAPDSIAVSDQREVPETQTKIVFSALQNGTFELFDLGSKVSIYKSPAAAAGSLTSINYSHDRSLLVTGSSTGIVSLYDSRALQTPLSSFKRTNAGIEDLHFKFGSEADKDYVGLAIATTDGLPYLARVVPGEPGVEAELVGVDCDAVRNVRVRAGGREVWSAGDDAIVRRYMLE